MHPCDDICKKECPQRKNIRKGTIDEMEPWYAQLNKCLANLGEDWRGQKINDLKGEETDGKR